MHDVGVVHGVVAALMRHIAVNGNEVACAFPIKKEKQRARRPFTLCAFSNLRTAVPIFFLLKILLLIVAAVPSLLLILRLLPPGVLGRSLAFAGFGCHGG